MKANIWENPKALLTLEKVRNERRNRSARLTYDCFNAIPKDDRVICKKGHLFSYVAGSTSLVAVLRGTTPSICKTCQDYDTE